MNTTITPAKPATFEEVVTSMQELTETNDHLSCYIIACSFLGSQCDDLKHCFIYLKELRNKNMGLNGMESQKVSDYYRELKVIAKDILTFEQYRRFYSAT
jgi:TorA maturation chaperone TorD